MWLYNTIVPKYTCYILTSPDLKVLIFFCFVFFPDKKSTPECSPTHSPFVKTRNNRKFSSTSVSSSTTSNGNSEKSAKKLDLVVPDGVAPIARTEEMSDDLSEETLVNGESSISEHSKSKKTNILFSCYLIFSTTKKKNRIFFFFFF